MELFIQAFAQRRTMNTKKNVHESVRAPAKIHRNSREEKKLFVRLFLLNVNIQNRHPYKHCVPLLLDF